MDKRMTIKIESKYSKEVLKARLDSLHKHKAWYSLPKGIVGKTKGSKLFIGIENGLVYWAGRGKLVGEVRSTDKGSILIGDLNSPAAAILIPQMFIIFLLALIPEDIISLLLLGTTFSIFGFFLVKADHSLLLKILNETCSK